jgi:Condensation domain
MFLDESFFSLAPASYAQARIWLDERVRFDPEKPQVAIYNMPFLYRMLSSATLSITQLRLALQLVVMKHQSLRTSLFFDTDENVLMQRIIEPSDDNHQLFAFVESTFASEEELSGIMHDERGNPNHFDLGRGLVFRCHILHHGKVPRDDLLHEGDALIFNFHHALFDFPSMELFHRDLHQAYSTGRLIGDDNHTSVRYLDCEFDIFSFSYLILDTCVLCRCRRRATNVNGHRQCLLA